MVILRWLLLVGFVAGCTEKNPFYCDRDADCADSSFAFCDVAGEYPESNHKPHTCTTVPESCPVERCGCDPGDGLQCDVDQLTTCNADGRSSSTSTCALGCSTAEPRCLTFEPSNGLGPALAMAAGEPDIVLDAGARIDTDLGLVQESGGAIVEVRSVVIEQDGGTSIRAFLGRSFVIDGATVQGSRAVAFVAQRRIALRGQLDASARSATKGAGGQEPPAGCAGVETIISMLTQQFSVGGSGGGNATVGGMGGGFGAGLAPGVAIPTFSPLVGGCRGGLNRNLDSSVRSRGGAGGGAVQLVSLGEITLTGTGVINVAGGGGESTAGGGSGGTIVLEAPLVRIDGATAGMAANGGAGGGCDAAGGDGTASTIPAPGPQCGLPAGNGGTGLVMAGDGSSLCGSPCFASGLRGGGGGAVGRARIATKSGTVETVGSPLSSLKVTSAMLVAR